MFGFLRSKFPAALRSHPGAFALLAIMILIAAASVVGALKPADAVFLAIAGLVVGTAQRLLAHEGKDATHAVRAALFGENEPGAHRHAYRSYLMAGAIALFVIVNATATTALAG